LFIHKKLEKPVLTSEKRALGAPGIPAKLRHANYPVGAINTEAPAFSQKGAFLLKTLP
jgi:hypothetical protein